MTHNFRVRTRMRSILGQRIQPGVKLRWAHEVHGQVVAGCSQSVDRIISLPRQGVRLHCIELWEVAA